MGNVEDKIKTWLDSKDKKKVDPKKMKKLLSPFKESKQPLKEDFEEFGDESIYEKMEKLVYSLDPDKLEDEQLMLRDDIVSYLESVGDQEEPVEPEDIDDEFGEEPMLDPEPEEMFNKYEGTKHVCPKCGKPQKEDTDGNLKYCQGH